ncbi:MAG: antibiotic biosynthesis monooxygenase [Marinicaulis sp.]|nr:antibiotic biosynthesis monooxygenase [Marinicaulis sp.]NNE42234.1 antibiotic biosynthesis monooxygenase [Marinicaulis sp.]NNL89130.1 antibiotic biosynthesis monooxygenase [Marinicaulis sp.]
MTSQFAPMAEPPYYVVIFTNKHNAPDDADYETAGQAMEELAKTMPGYLGFEAARGEDGFGFAISYWESEEAIANWKRQAVHLEMQKRGRSDWYEFYNVRIAKVERAYSMKTNKMGKENSK